MWASTLTTIARPIPSLTVSARAGSRSPSSTRPSAAADSASSGFAASKPRTCGWLLPQHHPPPPGGDAAPNTGPNPIAGPQLGGDAGLPGQHLQRPGNDGGADLVQPSGQVLAAVTVQDALQRRGQCGPVRRVSKLGQVFPHRRGRGTVTLAGGGHASNSPDPTPPATGLSPNCWYWSGGLGAGPGTQLIQDALGGLRVGKPGEQPVQVHSRHLADPGGTTRPRPPGPHCPRPPADLARRRALLVPPDLCW